MSCSFQTVISAAAEQSFYWVRPMPPAEEVVDNSGTEAGPTLSFIGPDLKGRDKYLGGELGADGNIYGEHGDVSTLLTCAAQLLLVATRR